MKSKLAGRIEVCHAARHKHDAKTQKLENTMKQIAPFFTRPSTVTAWSALLVGAAILLAQDKTPAIATDAAPQTAGIESQSGGIFDGLASQAIVAMKLRAEELHIKGVGVVAYVPGDRVESWSSKMVVVGSLKNPPSQKDPGSNLLGIAYAKAAEMADTLKNSGSGVRPPMKGELGWQGGLIQKGKTGYLIASFSGGPAEDDLKVAKAGLDILAAKL
jgi:hypothetical protein